MTETSNISIAAPAQANRLMKMLYWFLPRSAQDLAREIVKANSKELAIHEERVMERVDKAILSIQQEFLRRREFIEKSASDQIDALVNQRMQEFLADFKKTEDSHWSSCDATISDNWKQFEGEFNKSGHEINAAVAKVERISEGMFDTFKTIKTQGAAIAKLGKCLADADAQLGGVSDQMLSVREVINSMIKWQHKCIAKEAAVVASVPIIATANPAAPVPGRTVTPSMAWKEAVLPPLGGSAWWLRGRLIELGCAASTSESRFDPAKVKAAMDAGLRGVCLQWAQKQAELNGAAQQKA